MVFVFFKKILSNSSAFAYLYFFCIYLVVNRWCKNRTWLYLLNFLFFPSFSYFLFRFLLNNGLWNISFWLVLTISIQIAVDFLYFRLIIVMFFFYFIFLIYFYFCLKYKTLKFKIVLNQFEIQLQFVYFGLSPSPSSI